jgi:hypothetical protein
MVDEICIWNIGRMTIDRARLGVLRENHHKSHKQLWYDPYDLGTMFKQMKG